MAQARSLLFSARIRPRLERVLSLLEKFLIVVTGGDVDSEAFERHRAFAWDARHGPGRLIPIDEPATFDLDDLVGVDSAVARLIGNTEQFVNGLPANHVLLYGERGTGKSSAVRGLLERYARQGLRLVEVQKTDLVALPRILNALRQGDGQRFIIFCDDLSFGHGDEGYRELKAALEGSVQAPPENVLLIATSNRRHLLPESTEDNREARLDAQGELHLGEALEEKLALSDRFGLVLGFYSFNQDTYLEIVSRYLEKEGLASTLEEVRGDALRWALNHDSRSGRTARQFVTDLSGRLALKALRG